MPDATVAVVTRTRNRPLLLERAAASISSQTWSNLNWTVVNDGGDPAPVETIVEQFRIQGDTQSKCVHNAESVGMEAASNLGIRQSDTPYVALLDDDDTWEPTFLERCIRFLDSSPQYVGVATHSTRVHEAIEAGTVSELGREPFNPRLKSVDLAHIAIRNQVPNVSLVFRRSVWEAVSGYDESMQLLGDWDFLLRVLLHGDVGLIPEPLANLHIRRDDSSGGQYVNTVTAMRLQHIDAETRFRNKHFRKDLESGTLGLGHLLAQGKHTQVLLEELEGLRVAGDGWRKIYSLYRLLRLDRLSGGK